MKRNTKNTLVKLLCLAMVIAACALAMVACTPDDASSNGTTTGEPTGTQQKPHEHAYVWHEEVAATCTANGTKGHFTCECGKYFDADKKEITADDLAIIGGHNFVNYVCAGCNTDLSALAAKIDALPESNYSLADIPAINAVKKEFDALDNAFKAVLTNSARLDNAVSAISGVWVAAGADTLASGGQCDQSLAGFAATASEDEGLGTVVTIGYDAWQWANYRYNSTEKIDVGTKVALGVYNASNEAKGLHWGDGATVYTNADQVILQPGWNLITFTWEWDENAIGESYVIATHIYALSPVGNGENMNGWKFTALFAYSDEAGFKALASNSVDVGIQPAHVHKYIHHDKVDETCTVDGVAEHYTCECGKYFDVNKNPTTQAALAIARGHKFVDSVCSGCGLNVDAIIESIENLSLANLADVIAQYTALPEADKALVTNGYKLAALENLIVVDADTLTNWGDCGSIVTFTTASDDVYGAYGELNHTKSWASVKYASSLALQGLNKDLVVYIYNPTDANVDIAFGYVNDSHPESIFQGACYKYQTLNAKSWTKVVIEWSDAYNYYMELQHMLMIASTGSTCTAGNSVNLTGFKMSSMYIVDDAAALDALIPAAE